MSGGRYTKKIPTHIYFVGDGEWIQGPYVNPQKGRVNRKFLLTEVFDKHKVISDFVKNFEQWEQLSESEQATIKSIILTKKIKLLSTSASTHIHEERYIVDGETYRFTCAITDHSGYYYVERLKKKNK